MKRAAVLCLICCLSLTDTYAQYPVGDRWYNNPLGFEPVKLHTSMGFILPAVAAGACLLLTKKDPSLTDRLSLYTESGFSWGYKYPYTFLPQLNVGFNFQARKFLSLGVNTSVYLADDEFNHTAGFAIQPFARFYAVNTSSWQLYFESGGGLVYLVNAFPAANDRDVRVGTQLNGTTKYGIGAAVSMTPSLSASFGVRHLHISNGDTRGADRNPSHDSNGFFLGVNYRVRDRR